MLYLGIDIGGTNLSVGVVQVDGDDFAIIGRGKRRAHTPRPAEAICDDIVAAALDAISDAESSIGDFEFAGVGCPGVINAKAGVVEYSNNLGFCNVPLSAMLEERLGLPVRLENDASAAAFGEVVAGAAKGAQSAVVVTLGTGIGAGIIIDGHIFGGCNGVAGEVGHTLLIKDGIECTCGRHGCFEAYASAVALKRQTAKAMREHPDSLMWQLAGAPEKVSGRTPFEAMRMGDATATAVVEQYLDYLADGLTNIINILQPEVLCLGGGVSHEGDGLLIPLERLIAQRRFCRGNIAQPRIVCAQLLNDAGIIGAAFLGTRQGA